MERQIFGATAEVIEALDTLDGAVELPGVLDGEVRVVAIDIGTEGDKGIGDLRADSAESHDADLPAHELMAYEGLLVALCILHDVGIVRVVLDPVDGALGVTGVHEDHADNELLHGVRVAAGVIPRIDDHLVNASA